VRPIALPTLQAGANLDTRVANSSADRLGNRTVLRPVEIHGATPYEDVVVNIDAFRGVREGPIGGRIVVVAIASVVTVSMIVVLAVALAPPRPPGSILTGTTWQWTGATTGSAEVPLVVPDPSNYTIEFMSDSTFRTTADCNAVSGTYRTVSAGRTGLSSTGLRLRPGPYSLAACGPDSLSDAFLQGLWSAARYVIADSKLTILRSTQGTMTFDVGGPGANAPGGAQPAAEDGGRSG
jgi:heat shock protein HslJ